MAKKRKYSLPGRRRYKEKNPLIACRLPRADYEKLKEIPEKRVVVLQVLLSKV
jgi:hypothetical protein